MICFLVSSSNETHDARRAESPTANLKMTDANRIYANFPLQHRNSQITEIRKKRKREKMFG